MDEDDVEFLMLINKTRDTNQILTEDQFELIITYLDAVTHVRMIENFQNRCDYSIEHDERVYCEVCKDIYNEPGNDMVFCDSCNICVHQSCYGIAMVPAGDWYCTPCKSGVLSPVCLFCMQSGGAFKPTNSAEWVHVFCALWIPEVGFGSTEKMEPITKIKQIPASRWSLSCCFCQERIGVCIQCATEGCYKAFHPTCAYDNQSFMHIIYGSESRPEQVINEAYCLRHSEKARKGPLPDTSMPLPEVAPTKGNPLYTEQFKILNNIQSRFHEFIDANEISCNLGIHIFFIKSVFGYWKDRRKGNGNNPLIQLPALNFLASRKKDSSKKDSCNEIDPFLKLVSLRQDLERARALIYLTERRERLKKKMIESVSHIILKSIEQGKSIAFPSNLYSKSRRKLHEGWEENSDGSLSISQTSYCKVFSSPQRQHESYQPNAGEMLVANEVELKEQKCSPLSQQPSKRRRKESKRCIQLNLGGSSGKENSNSENVRSSDPEWKETKRKTKKKGKSKKATNKLPDLSSKFVLAFSDASEYHSSQDDLSHFSTPPTSPEYSISNTANFSTPPSTIAPPSPEHEIKLSASPTYDGAIT